jgi:hypothetical protein
VNGRRLDSLRVARDPDGAVAPLRLEIAQPEVLGFHDVSVAVYDHRVVHVH